MITASEDGTAIMWDVSSPATPRRIGRPLADHRGAVNHVAFSPDGSTFATAGADKKVILWRTRDTVQPVKIGKPFGKSYRASMLRRSGRAVV